MCHKQKQKADVYLLVGISNENKHNITFLYSDDALFILFPFMLHFTAIWSPWWLTHLLHIPLNIAYYSMKYRNTYPINIFCKWNHIPYIVPFSKEIYRFSPLDRKISSFCSVIAIFPSPQIIYMFSANFQLLPICLVFCDSCLFKKISLKYVTQKST